MTHDPTDELRRKVSSYARLGINQDDIARVLDIAPKTLRKHYRDELDKSAIMANGDVGGALYTKALDGDTTAMIWWTKTRMKWSEHKTVDMTLSTDADMIEKMRKARERLEQGVETELPTQGPEIDAMNYDEGDLDDEYLYD